MAANPVAKALKHLKHKVIPNKKRKKLASEIKQSLALEVLGQAEG